MPHDTPDTGSVPPIAEGKTKRVYAHPTDPTKVFLASKDDITAGDGAQRDVIPGKGAWANQTTCNVFRLLQAHDVPLAFLREAGTDLFLARKCRMLPYEVVVRRAAYGSYLKRNPNFEKGYRFPQLIVEFFLKTAGKEWKQYDLPCDDPLMSFRLPNLIGLHDPAKPASTPPFCRLRYDEVFTTQNEHEHFPAMETITQNAFLLLEVAWQRQSCTLVDFKVEFGIDSTGALLLADVIDNDSWRVIEDGVHLDKQQYREGSGLDAVAATYRRVAEMTDLFPPRVEIAS